MIFQIKGMFLNKYETDSPLCVLLIASDNIIDMSISYLNKINLRNKNIEIE